MKATVYQMVKLELRVAVMPSTLEDHLRDGLVRGMRDRKSSVASTEFGGEFFGFAMEAYGGTSAGHAHDLAIAPAHTVIPSGAQRLHCCFLRGEPSCITLGPICLRVAISNLALSKNALQKARSETLNRLSYAIDFGNINSGSDNHALASYSKRSPR